MLYHIYSRGDKAEYSNFLPAVTNGYFTSKFVGKTHILLPLSFRDALRKVMSKPRIRAKMLDGWKDVERIIKACLTLFGLSELS